MNTGKNISGVSKRRKTDLTVEEIKKLPGYENLLDDETRNIISSIKEFSLLMWASLEIKK